MKNWALTNWLDWFERQREGRAGKATLEPCKADQRGSHQGGGTKSGSSVQPLCQGHSSGGGCGRWGGGDRSYRCTERELGAKPVGDRNFVSLHHSLSSSQSGTPGLPLTPLGSQALGPLLPGTKRSSPTLPSPTRVRAGKPVLEPQEARILLESGKSLNGQAPEPAPRSEIPRMKGSLSTHIAGANYFSVTATVFRQSVKGVKLRLTLLPLLPKARKFTSEVVWCPIYTSYVAWECGGVIPLAFWSPREFRLCFCTTSKYSRLSKIMNQGCLLGFQGIKRIL